MIQIKSLFLLNLFVTPVKLIAKIPSRIGYNCSQGKGMLLIIMMRCLEKNIMGHILLGYFLILWMKMENIINGYV